MPWILRARWLMGGRGTLLYLLSTERSDRPTLCTPPQLRGNWVNITEPGHSRPIACLICALLRGTFHPNRMAAHPAVEIDMSNGMQLVSPQFVWLL